MERCNDCDSSNQSIGQSGQGGDGKAAEIHGKHIDPSGWAGREIGRFVADFVHPGVTTPRWANWRGPV